MDKPVADVVRKTTAEAITMTFVKKWEAGTAQTVI